MNINTSRIDKILDKLERKDPSLLKALTKKIIQISEMDSVALNHLKNLKGEMSHLKRVHLGSFVLTFRLEGEDIIFYDFAHHDDIY